MAKTEVPVARIIKLLAKVLRLIDLLVLVGDVADDAADR